MDYRKTVLVLFALGIILRLFVFTLPISDDNGLWGFHIRAHNAAFLQPVAIPHPPVGPWLYDFSSLLFGSNEIALRAVPVFSSLLVAMLVFLIAKKFFDKKTAVLALAIFLFAFFPFASSVIIDSDNTVLAIVAAAMLFLTMKTGTENKSKKTVVLLGLLCGIGLMTKIQAIFFALPVLVVFFIYRKNFKEFLVETTIFLAAATIAAGAILLVVFFSMPQYFPIFLEAVLLHPGEYARTTQLTLLFSQMFPFFVALTPLFFLPAFFFFKRGEREKIPLIWILLVGVPYFIFIPMPLGQEFVRYFSVLAPAATLLLASVVSKARLNKEHAIKAAILSVALFIVFFALNSLTVGDSFYLIGTTYLGQRISHAALFPFLPVAGALLVFLAFRKLAANSLNKNIFVLFLSLCIAFNAFMVSNFFLQTEYRVVLQSALDELRANGFKKPLYSWGKEIPFYAGYAANYHWFKSPKETAFLESIGLKKQDGYFDLDWDFEGLEQSIKNNGGTVVLLHYPKTLVLEKDPKRMKTLELIESACVLRKRFAILDAESVIYDCAK